MTHTFKLKCIYKVYEKDFKYFLKEKDKLEKCKHFEHFFIKNKNFIFIHIYENLYDYMCGYSYELIKNHIHSEYIDFKQEIRKQKIKKLIYT